MHHFRTNSPPRQIAPAETSRGLHARIIRYCSVNKMADSTFGRRALNDPAFVRRLRDQRHAPTATTVERVLAFIEGRIHA